MSKGIKSLLLSFIQICFISTYPDSFDMRTFIPNRGGAEVLDSESRSDANVRQQSCDGVYVRQDEHTFVLLANMQRVNSGCMKRPSAMTFFSMN
jgi:hypothetical protein